jgi:hypothetical protein
MTEIAYFLNSCLFLCAVALGFEFTLRIAELETLNQCPMPGGRPRLRAETPLRCAGTNHENSKGYGHETRNTDTLFSNYLEED